MAAISLLIASAHECSVEATLVAVGTAHARVPVVLPSEDTVTYDVELSEGSRGHVCVREQAVNRRLPTSCAERHINDDGSFCLYWADSPEEAHPVHDVRSATDWWTLLKVFLRRQETARQLGIWVGDARAHGAAAHHQSTAERIAAAFGPQFARDLRGGALQVARRERRGRRMLELSRHGVLLARVASTDRGRIDTAIRCPCDVSLGQTAIAVCGGHRDDLRHFIVAVDQWHELERRFYEHARAQGRRCCNTMRYCPLRDTRRVSR